MIYRQIAHRLRLQMGPGKPDIVSERPRQKKTGRYLDLDQDGLSTTRIEIPEGALVDVDQLVRIGAIEAVPRWRTAPEPTGEGEAGSGEAPS